MTQVFRAGVSNGWNLVHYALAAVLSAQPVARAQTDYDLVLKGGHVIDGKNRLSAVRDVAIKDGKIAAVEPGIAASRALKSVDVSGLCHSRPGRHTRARLCGPYEEFLRQRGLGIVSRRLHASRRRDDRGGRPL